MRALRIFALLIGVLLLGCSPNNVSSRGNSDSRSQPDNDMSIGKDQNDGSVLTHVIKSDAEYYTSGPQQGRPPDGKFSRGTRVEVVEGSGSYVLVRSHDGIEAYVATDVVQKQDDAKVDLSALVQGNNRFAVELYKQLRANEGNLFFSPSSISVALAMTYAGAAGQTKSEMAQALHFDLADKELHEAMNALQSQWQLPDKKTGVKLSLANRLWGNSDYQFSPEYLALTRESYGAELARLNFEENELARQTINNWVEAETQNKINELFSPGSIQPNTKLVLTNAVYFHGDWSKPFDKELTKDEDFSLGQSDKVKVAMMHRIGAYRYAEVDDLQLLDLPYGNGNFSMVVLLPKSIDGLAGIESQLNSENLQQWISSLKDVDEVKVYLPKFKTTSKFELNEELKSMGMKSAFDPNTADFSGMTGKPYLFVSTVIHKAFVDVNEEGTEAAAATGVDLTPTSAAEPSEPPVFRADHPFVFMIRDTRNESILFMGRIANPLE